MKLILASGSLERKQILDSLNVKYEIFKSEVEEFSENNNPAKYCEELSLIKAKDVADRIGADDVVIVAADSIIYKDGKKYEKPKSMNEAKQNLREFSGGKNQAITGVTIIDKNVNKIVTFSDITDVYFNDINEKDIESYVQKNKEFILDRAGYTVEGVLSLFISKIEGDYCNILGLPLGKLYSKLNEFGYYLNDFE